MCVSLSTCFVSFFTLVMPFFTVHSSRGESTKVRTLLLTTISESESLAGQERSTTGKHC